MKFRLLALCTWLLLSVTTMAQSVNRVEYFFDNDPGLGNATALPVTPGDTVVINSIITIPATLPNGLHILFVRAGNENGVWGMPEATLINVNKSNIPVNGVEYFFDTDPGFGNGTPLNFAPADSATIMQNITLPPGLSFGEHTLFVRAKDTTGMWSMPERYTFTICGNYGPTSAFGHFLNGNEMFFSDSSANTVSREWLFGDGQTDTSANPRHVYAEANNYTVQLITHNTCGTDTLVRQLAIPGLQSIYPNEAPATGLYTAYITGTGFVPGTTISIQKTVGAGINADTTIYIDDTHLKIILAANSAPTGLYDLVANIPAAGERTLQQAVTVAAPVPVNITVKLEGRKIIRFNSWSSLRVVCTNNGNTTALGVPVIIKLPGYVEAQLMNQTDDSTLPQIIIDSSHSHFYHFTDSITGEQKTMAFFIIPYIEPGMSAEIDFEIKSLVFDETFPVSIFTAKPIWTDSIYLAGARSAAGGRVQGGLCDLPPCLKCMLDIAGFTPLGCAIGIYNMGCSGFNALKESGDPKKFRNTRKKLFDFIGQTGGMALSCFTSVVPVGKLFDLAAKAGDKASNGWGALNDCGECFFKKPDVDSLKARFSLDPNSKYGPGGFNSQNYTRWQDPFNYSIYFENISAATAPAAEVQIIDYLDTAKLDMRTFKFSGFGFADTSFRFEVKDTLFVKDVDLRPAKNAILRVSGKLDSLNKLVFRFITFDPGSMALTRDIDAGFLNPNLNGKEGVGYVSFQVKAKPNLPTGTVIANTADIIFDANTPIITNTYSNAIDKQQPFSEVQPSPQRVNDTTFRINWTGGDAHAGVGMYFIYVSTNDSAYVLKKVTDSLEILFTGKPGNTYKFYSVAEDLVDNMENTPSGPDLVLTVTLPFAWIEFDAVKENGAVKLQWSAINEPNNSRFEITRGSDSVHFTSIGSVNGTNNFNVVNHYSFTDNAPLKGINYYRLRQVNVSGPLQYSNIRQALFNEPGLFIGPSPVKKELFIRFNDGLIRQVNIYNMNGQLVWQRNGVNRTDLVVYTEKMPAGVYTIRVTDANGSVFTRKFIRQ